MDVHGRAGGRKSNDIRGLGCPFGGRKSNDIHALACRSAPHARLAGAVANRATVIFFFFLFFFFWVARAREGMGRTRGITATSRRTSDHISWAAELSMCTHERGAAQDGAVDTDRQAPWGNRGGCEVARSTLDLGQMGLLL